MNKPWPKDGKPASFHEITGPIVKAIQFTYKLKRQNQEKDVPWKGLDIGESLKATCFVPDENLTADSLDYQLENQGRSPLEVIIRLAVQLGMEQGKRVERGERTSLKLAFIYATELKNVLERMNDETY